MMLEVKGPTDNVHIHPGEGGGRPGSGGIKEHQVHYWQPLCTTPKYPENKKNKPLTFLFQRAQDLHISCGELKVVDLSQLAPEWDR